MDTHLEIKCPDCGTILIVDRITGKILETRKPLVENSTGDRFNDSFEKVKKGTAEAEALFQKSMEAEKNKKKDLDELFNKSLDQVKKDGPVGPQKNFLDMD